MRKYLARTSLLTGLACALIAACLIGLARAAEEPEIVTEAVAEAEGECEAAGGRPNSEAMLLVDDLNNDGGEDWIVDYAKLKCAGAPNPFCGSGGCTLQVYLWAEDSEWVLAFDELVTGYKFIKRGDKAVLQATMGGAACGRPNVKTCNVNYRIERDEILQSR